MPSVSLLPSEQKGIRGEITSAHFFWVGIPDFIYGFSALIVGWLVMRKAVGDRFLLIWSLIGAGIILLPTFVFMNYWMNEPGFTFIMEFPMVLAPSIVVPIFKLKKLTSDWKYNSLTKITDIQTIHGLLQSCDHLNIHANWMIL